MSGEGPSELPQFYGGKTSDGELVKRPREDELAAVVASPSRAYYPRDRSPDRGITDSDADVRIGLRRRPSAPGPGSRDMPGEYDKRPSFSRRRIRDEAEYDDRDYERGPRRHDDLDYPYERRLPRSHRNPEPYTSKPYFEETRGDYHPDEEPRTPRRRRRDYDEESIDGYDYSRHHHRGRSVEILRYSREDRAEVLKLPWSEWMNSDFKNHFVATIGEFVGTTMFLFFAFAGTEVANIGTNKNSSFDVNRILYISLIFGFSLMVNVWIFFRISGGLFNPAVTLGMVLVGAIPLVRALCLFVAQLAGGIAASAMVLGLFPQSLSVNTSLGGNATLVQGVFIEALLTAELVFTIFMLAKEKHKATFIAPVGIGLALFIAEMVGVYYTGGSLNPARSFGPAVISASFVPEHWIYWVGPLIGALIAVFFYKFIKILEYEMANPGQDGDPLNDPTQNDDKLADVLSRRLSKSKTSTSDRRMPRRSEEMMA